MLRPSALVFFACLVATTATGCVHKPTMHLDHAEVSGLQMVFPQPPAVQMTVVVNVYNPNSYDVAVRAVRGQVVLANQYPVPVNFAAPGDGLWLGSDATTQVRVPVVIPVPIAMAVLQQAWTTSPTIPYRMTGKADVTGTRTFKIESDDYSVDEQGLIDRQQIDATLRGMLVIH